MPERDIVSEIKVEFLETITLTGTGDIDGSVSVDTQKDRAVVFMIDPAADIPGDADILLQAIDSADDSTFAEVAADKMLPTPGDGTLDLMVAANKPRQTYGCWSVNQYVRPRFNATAITGSVDVNVFAITKPDLRPVDGVATDGQP